MGGLHAGFFEGFYNGDLWENTLWSIHKYINHQYKNNTVQLYSILETTIVKSSQNLLICSKKRSEFTELPAGWPGIHLPPFWVHFFYIHKVLGKLWLNSILFRVDNPTFSPKFCIRHYIHCDISENVQCSTETTVLTSISATSLRARFLIFHLSSLSIYFVLCSVFQVHMIRAVRNTAKPPCSEPR